MLGGQAEFQELEVWDVTYATEYCASLPVGDYSLNGQRIALGRDGGVVN